MANDVNKTFSSLAGLFLMAGIAAAMQIGIGGLLFALFACYVMLVAANGISRGEKKVSKKWQR